ncbi:hypothetical protein NDA14_006429 [Ustilago hordei]|nr:hypothetical protein NDA14_006429 [Ustilago hordei]
MSGGARRPSALFKAWKSRRGSATTATTQQAQVAAVGGRRKSSALTAFLPTSTLARGGEVGRVGKHSLPPSSTRASSSDDTRRRSLSIICRGHRDSDDEEVVMESHTTPRCSTNPGGARGEAVTAAMAIRDTWLYSSHQYSKDGRKGSVSTVATSPSYSQHLPRKSFSGVATVGLHMENDERQQRVKGMRKEAGADANSVVSLSLTEEIALYTTDDRNRRSADSSSSTGQSSRYSPPKGVPGAGEGGMGGMTWNMPNWNTAAPRLPELSPAPAIMIADPFAEAPPLSVVARAEMQRVESGSLDPVLSPIPASSPSLENGDGEEQAGLQWDTTSPFTSLNHRPSMVAENHSPTAPNLLPSPPWPITEQVRRRATTYYDASWLVSVVDELPTSPCNPKFFMPRSPDSPRSPKSLGHSEPSYALRRRESYPLPRPPLGYQDRVSEQGEGEGEGGEEEEMPTPRLVPMDLSSSSPMSSNFAPETPSNVATCFPHFDGDADVTIAPSVRKGEEGEEDLHAQFCSALLLDLGNGTAIPLSPSPGIEGRPDPFTLLAQ